MANISKIRLSGTTYTIVDDSAIHALDGYWNSGQTQDAITAATSALAETIAEQGYQTATDVQNAISGKADSSAVTEEISAAVSGKADTSALTVYADAVAYDSNAKEMKFYHGGTGGTVVFSYDASPFLIDGMVESVVITSITSGASEVQVLEITWNSAAGSQVTDIPLSEIFDPTNYYTKTEVDTALSGKQDTLIAGAGIEIDSANTISITGIPLTIDDTVTSGSSNPVKSSGIYNFVTGETSTKQDTLVSGTNIKTVGTQSVLGSGNIALMTASIGTGNDSETLIFDFA